VKSGIAMSTQPSSPSGLETIPHLSWGSHLAHFFGSGDELRELLVPYFKAGLENNEQCLWVTGAAFNAEDARPHYAPQCPIWTGASAANKSKSQMAVDGMPRRPRPWWMDSLSENRRRSRLTEHHAPLSA
jgi:hypothetical protein